VKTFPAFGIMLRSRGQESRVRELLAENSGLPGPRANLELAHSFAASVSGMRIEDWQWDFLTEMARTSLANAPENTPKVFLPVCGLMALGALYGDGLPRPRRRVALALLTSAASDRRWRVREAVAMGLQLIGEKDPAALREIVDGWLPKASLLEMRAIVAGLAHPPLLADGDFALYCLDTARAILSAVSRVPEKNRKDESLKILRQGLGYALSVFTAHRPEEGFKLMTKSAAIQDRDIAWIIVENLKKQRLLKDFPSEVRHVEAILKEASGR
jgi:hypothetical protein